MHKNKLFKFYPPTGTGVIVCMLFMGQKAVAQTGAMDMVKEARKQIQHLTPLQAKQEIEKGNVILIDIREADELKTGTIAGAVHAPRGMLEFYADSTLSYYNPLFQKDKRIILYCTSSGRSALATQTLQAMGYHNVAHIDGGLKAWKEAGLPIVQ